VRCWLEVSNQSSLRRCDDPDLVSGFFDTVPLHLGNVLAFLLAPSFTHDDRLCPCKCAECCPTWMVRDRRSKEKTKLPGKLCSLLAPDRFRGEKITKICRVTAAFTGFTFKLRIRLSGRQLDNSVFFADLLEPGVNLVLNLFLAPAKFAGTFVAC